MTPSMSFDTVSAEPTEAEGSHGTTMDTSPDTPPTGAAGAEGSPVGTSDSSLGAASAEPADVDGSVVAAAELSADSALGEPVDADGLGEAAADDPADADAEADEGLVVAGSQAGTGTPGTATPGTPGNGRATPAGSAAEVGRSADGEAGAWLPVCALDRLTPDRGRAALVGGQQVAVFRLSGGDTVYAIGNRDPFSGAHVLSRGIVGDKGGVPKVASPVFKQSFDLRTGQCLDDPDVSVPSYPVRVDDGWILIEAPGESP